MAFSPKRGSLDIAVYVNVKMLVSYLLFGVFS